MKKAFLTAALIVISSSFATAASKGENVALKCVTTEQQVSFTIEIVKDTKNALIKMVLTSSAATQQPRTYNNVKETLPPRMMAGGSILYTVPVAGGQLSLRFNSGLPVTPLGRRGTFIAQTYGQSTVFPVVCVRP